MKIVLAPMAGKVDDAADVEHVEAGCFEPRLQELANVRLDQDQRGRAIRQQAREVVAERLIVSNNHLVALRTVGELVHYVVYS